MSSVLRSPRLSPESISLGGERLPLDPRLEQLVAQAAEEAYARGLEEGARQEARRLDESGNRLVRELEAAVSRARQDLQSEARTATSEMLELARAAVELIVGAQPAGLLDAAWARVEQALAEIDERPLRLWLAPADLEALQELVDRTDGLEAAADPSLAAGEARLEGRWATAELTRSAALEAIREALDA